MTNMAEPDFPPKELQKLVEEIAAILRERKETLCVVETAAGGLISAALLSVPGASRFYRGGHTLYTLESRVAHAGWTQADIDAYRGPTPELVAGLARHVRGTLGSTYALGESGTAGPTGGNTRNRTPGYVALAVVDGKGGEWKRDVETGVPEGEGQRRGNMVRFAGEALMLLRDVLTGEAKL